MEKNANKKLTKHVRLPSFGFVAFREVWLVLKEIYDEIAGNLVGFRGT